MASVIFKYSNKFGDSIKQYDVTRDELDKFRKLKEIAPLQPLSKDYKYKAGHLKNTGLSHAGVGDDLNIVYELKGNNPYVFYIYCFVNHEDSGTGNPGKPNKQKSFAKRLMNMTFESRKNK